MRRTLQPRTAGDTVGEILGLMVEHWTTILGIVAGVTLPFLAIQAVVSRGLIDYVALANDELVVDRAVLRNSLLIGLFSFAASALAAGGVIHAVGRIYLGARVTIGESLSHAASHLGVLIIGGLIWLFGVGVGSIFFVIPGVIIATGWFVWAGAAVLEDMPTLAALRRSWQLTSGRRLQVFGVAVVLVILAFVMATITTSIADALGQPARQPPNFNTSMLSIAANIVVSALFPVGIAVVYLELRTRSESAELVLADLRTKIGGDDPTPPA